MADAQSGRGRELHGIVAIYLMINESNFKRKDMNCLLSRCKLPNYRMNSAQAMRGALPLCSTALLKWDGKGGIIRRRCGPVLIAGEGVCARVSLGRLLRGEIIPPLCSSPFESNLVSLRVRSRPLRLPSAQRGEWRGAAKSRGAGERGAGKLQRPKRFHFLSGGWEE